MKTKVLLFSTLFLSGINAVSAQQINNTTPAEPVLKMIKEQDAKNLPIKIEEGFSVIYHETFDKIPGSIESPAELPVNKQNQIDSKLLDEKGFAVGVSKECKGVGGGIMVSDSEKGSIAVYLKNLEGRHRTFHVYFRVKSATGKPAPFNIGTYNNFIQNGSLTSGTAEPNAKDFFLMPYEQYGGRQTSIEIHPENMNEGVILDEMIVVVPDTIINGVVMKPATEIADDGFTANWEYSSDAKGAWLDVFTYADEATEHEVQSGNTNFADIKVNGSVINKEDPNMPENWTFRFSKDFDKKVEKTDKGYAIYLNKTIENITTPNNDELIYHSLAFDLKGAADSKSYLLVEEKVPFPIDERGWRVYDGYKWNVVAKLPLSEYADFKHVDLTDKLTGEGIYYRFRVSDNDIEHGAAITNISYTYGGGKYHDKEYAEGLQNVDMTLEDKSWAVSGITPGKEYFYRLRAFDELGNVSDYSIKTSGKGGKDIFELPVPVATEATNINDAAKSFTANWEYEPSMDYRICQVWKEFNVTSDIEDKLVFSADMKSVNGGTATPENPMTSVTFQPTPTMYYTDALPGFTSKYAVYANGMFGIRSGNSWGELKSPVYSLGDNMVTLKLNIASGTIGTKCKVSCYNDPSGDNSSSRTINVTQIPQEIKLSFPSSNYTYFVFEYGDKGHIMFDKLEILADAMEGDILRAMTGEKITKDLSTDFTVNSLEEGDSYLYQVRHWYTCPNESLGYDKGISDPSNSVYVWQNFVPSGIETVKENTDNAMRAFVTSNGMLNINLSESAPVNVYNISGVLVKSIKAQAGNNTVKLDNNGVYVVVSGKNHVKVVY